MTEAKQPVSAKQVKQLVASGKEYCKTAFPNPTREGCPNAAILRAMAHRDRRFSLSDLPVNHVVRCSPCFQQYQHLRRRFLFTRGLRVATAAAALLVVLLAAVRLIRVHPGTSGQKGVAKSEGPVQPRVTVQRNPPSSAPLAITVDLAAFSPIRGEEAKGSANKIRLPSKLLRVSFLMPVGMEAGEYSLRLEDSAGNALQDIRTLGHLTGGVTSVQVDLDLTPAAGRSFTLQVRPPGLGLRRYPVVVE